MHALLLLLELLQPAHARCAERYSSDAVLRAAEHALDAFGSNSISSFHSAVADAEQRALCLNEVARPDALARMYAAFGVAAFLDKQPTRMTTWFQVARYLDPGWECPDSLGPLGHPVRQACEGAVGAGAEAFAALGSPVDLRGALFIDGLLARELPVARPYLAQQVLPSGRLAETWLVKDEPPAALTGARKDRWATALGGAAAGSAALAAGLWIGTNASFNAYTEAADEYRVQGAGKADLGVKDQAERLLTRVNALGDGALIASGLSVGLATAAIVVKF